MLRNKVIIGTQLINILNIILLIGIVFLIVLKRTKKKSLNFQKIDDFNSLNFDKSKSESNESLDNILNEKINKMSYDEFIKFHREKYLKRYQKITYLDYATNPVISDCLLENFTRSLHQNLFGNTHSESPSAELSSSIIDDVRKKILNFFGTKFSEYTPIFTYSNYNSLKLIAESFPFSNDTYFYYTLNSNQNIIRLKDFAHKKSAKSKLIKLNDILSNSFENKFIEVPSQNVSFNLLIVPLVDEFDGSVLTQAQIDSLSHLNYKDPENEFNSFTVVAVDASLYLQSNKLNLSKTPFHAVTVSFEKIFGFPNIACVLIHNSLIIHLTKPYFGGGTLVYALTGESYEKLRINPQERFEDGSLPFLSIVSIESGFSLFNAIQFERIHKHIKEIGQYIIKQLIDLRYNSGSPLIQLYGVLSKSFSKGIVDDLNDDSTFSIITFNILDKNAEIIPYQDVLKLFSENDFYLTGGCFSTPFSCCSALNINVNELNDKHGAIRISFGWATTTYDIDNFIAFLKTHFIHE